MNAAEMFWKRGPWTVEIYNAPDSGDLTRRPRVRIVCDGHHRTLADYPICYDNGIIAFDHHDIPRDVQRATARAFAAAAE